MCIVDFIRSKDVFVCLNGVFLVDVQVYMSNFE